MRYWDPNGTNIVLQGSPHEVAQLFTALTELTDDTLQLHRVCDGKYAVTIASMSYGGSLTGGTELIRDLTINDRVLQNGEYDDYNTVIQIVDSSSGKPNSKAEPQNTCTEITIFLEQATKDTPLYMLIAHELIHAMHNKDQTAIPATQKSPVYDPALKASISTLNEELATIGLKGWIDNDITENKIRAEHGLPLRRGHHHLP